jgi:hypothetical protein
VIPVFSRWLATITKNKYGGTLALMRDGWSYKISSDAFSDLTRGRDRVRVHCGCCYSAKHQSAACEKSAG